MQVDLPSAAAVAFSVDRHEKSPRAALDGFDRRRPATGQNGGFSLVQWDLVAGRRDERQIDVVGSWHHHDSEVVHTWRDFDALHRVASRIRLERDGAEFTLPFRQRDGRCIGCQLDEGLESRLNDPLVLGRVERDVDFVVESTVGLHWRSREKPLVDPDLEPGTRRERRIGRRLALDRDQLDDEGAFFRALVHAGLTLQPSVQAAEHVDRRSVDRVGELGIVRTEPNTPAPRPLIRVARELSLDLIATDRRKGLDRELHTVRQGRVDR